MGFFYLGYGILYAIFIFFYCRRNKLPIWWLPLVLIFPPAVLVLILKKKSKKRFLMATAVITGLGLVIGAEVFLYLSKTKNAAPTIPPVIQKVIALNEAVKQTTIEIYNTTEKLFSLSMVQSRIGDIKSTIRVIEKLRDLETENLEAIDRLVRFAEKRQDLFVRQKLDWIFFIRQFYSDKNVLQHQKSRANYLKEFENFLTYTRDNFNNIMELKNPRHMKNYEAYYMRYRQAADSHNRFNRKRIDFQNKFVEAHPEVKPFLPGSHQTEPFKFWDKFKF